MLNQSILFDLKDFTFYLSVCTKKHLKSLKSNKITLKLIPECINISRK
jgi:hypothetical protein